MTSSSIAPAMPGTTRFAGLRVWATALIGGVMWFEVVRDSAASAHAPRAWLVPVLGLATQLLFTAAEAAVATVGWRALGTRVRWRSLAPRILVASSAETLAVSIAVGRAALPHAVALALAGPRAGGVIAPMNGAAAAFAAVGALALVRMLLSARLQADAAGAPIARAFWLVSAMWAVSRLALLWTFDLLNGRSFQP